jgi:hypothetical protein
MIVRERDFQADARSLNFALHKVFARCFPEGRCDLQLAPLGFGETIYLIDFAGTLFPRCRLARSL